MSIETLAGLKRVALNLRNGTVETVSVDMGMPLLNPREIPVVAQRAPVIDLPLMVNNTAIAVTCVSMGNPHAVTFLASDPDEFPLDTIGPAVEHHPAFPNRVNFEACQVVSPEQLKVRVWERGAGPTLACGTGACAATIAARLKGLVGDRCVVQLPGGALEVMWDGTKEVWMSGPAEMVFKGTWLKQ